jgi:hypothetical protein
VRITLVQSSDGVSAIPAAIQTAGTTWDITLATGTITTGGVISLIDARTYIQFNTDHVRRDGDTMSGNLTISNTTPGIIINETDGATDNKRWQLIAIGESLRLQTATDSGGAASFLIAERTGTTVDSIALTAGSLTLNGNTVFTTATDGVGSGLDADLLDGQQGSYYWNPANDGAGSGLDADLLDGLQSTQLARLAAASNFTTAPTINGNEVWHAGNDGTGSGLDADKVRGVTIAAIRRQGGNASNWNVPGTTNYSPNSWILQVGAEEITYVGPGVTSGTINITFPQSFSGTPILTATATVDSLGSVYSHVNVCVTAINSSSATLQWIQVQGTQLTRVAIAWQAIGAA